MTTPLQASGAPSSFDLTSLTHGSVAAMPWRCSGVTKKLAAYDQALAIKPNLAAAWSGRGNVCSDLKRHDEAFAAYDEALALEPDLAEAWLGRGIVAAGLKHHDEALAAYDRALALKPTLAEAWLGRGNLLAVLQRYDQALAAYDKALAIKPDIAGIAGARLLVKMHCCDWSEFERDCDRLIQSVRNNQEFAFPFVLFGVCSSAEEQMACARSIAANCYPAIRKPLWRGETYRHDKIRVGYVSADFHQHATAFLAAAVFESHDRKKFDVTAFSFGPNDGSKMRRRLESAFDRFLDLRGFDDERLASEIRQLEIDILVDLKGFTQDSRPGIFAHRPAPVQINYLGFPGTLGADYMDYIIADETLIGDDERQYYSEKIVRLPHSYQPNDRSRPMSTRNFTRTECGLPESAFVYCCFNNNYKITPAIFDCWMRILDRVGDGVLWLLEDHPAAAVNLQNEARRRGVDPRRIIFAKRLPLSEHLARHRLADLFLDTLPQRPYDRERCVVDRSATVDAD
jgi:protein O-GlcNAc transferase